MDNDARKAAVGSPNKKKSTIIPGGLFLSFFILFIFFLPGYNASDITWVPNLEWNTNNNWENGFVPKNGTHVVFPVEMRLSVGLPVRSFTLDLGGLELPRDGALVLPETGSLAISPVQSSAKIARWTREGPLLWVDPDNWKSVRSVPAVPNLEQIPCQQDVVVLPGVDRTLSIRLPDTPGTKVRAVKVMNVSGVLPSWEWRHARERKEFSFGPMTVEYNDLRSCEDCPCQQEVKGKEILREVCDVVKSRCPDLACEYPISVEGHCCHYCGGRVQVTNKTSVSLLRTMANDGLKNFGSTLSWYARRTWNSQGEILITGKNGLYSVQDTAQAIAVLTDVLREQGIEIINTETTGSALRLPKAAMILGPFFGALIIILLVLLVVFPYFGYSLPEIFQESWSGLRNRMTTGDDGVVEMRTGRTLLQRPFGFARFENTPESEVELSPSPDGNDIQGDEDEEKNYVEGGRGGQFANPLYRSKRKSPEVAQSFAVLQRAHEHEGADEEIDLAIEA